MCKFHITGLEGFHKNSDQIKDGHIDITVFADTLKDAIDKAEGILGCYISTLGRRVVVEECEEW